MLVTLMNEANGDTVNVRAVRNLYRCIVNMPPTSLLRIMKLVFTFLHNPNIFVRDFCLTGSRRVQGKRKGNRRLISFRLVSALFRK